MINYYLIGTLEQVTVANAQIEINAGYPCEGTSNWSVPAQAYEQDFWFIAMPESNAIYNWHTGEELMEGVSNVQQEESQENWWPPFNPSTI